MHNLLESQLNQELNIYTKLLNSGRCDYIAISLLEKLEHNIHKIRSEIHVSEKGHQKAKYPGTSRLTRYAKTIGDRCWNYFNGNRSKLSKVSEEVSEEPSKGASK